MKSKYLLMDNRYLLKFFAAKSPWTVLFFLTPLFAGVVYFIRQKEVFDLGSFLLSLPLAFLYWSLVEYLIHRNYFHWLPKNESLRRITGSFHLYHHENPSDLEVINSGWVTAFVGVIFHFAVFHFVLQVNYLFSLYLTASLLVVYYGYEWVHYMVHQRIFAKGLMNYLQNFHLTHHVSPKKNFGQISPIWDFVLGTIGPNMETKDNPRMRRFVKGAENER